MKNEPARIAIECAGPGQIKELECAIRAYGRQERAKGLRAAARQARREAERSRKASQDARDRLLRVTEDRMDARCNGELDLARKLDRRARQVEKGE